MFEPKLETGRVKLEGGELYQTGSSTQGRLRTALSEVCLNINLRLLFTHMVALHFLSLHSNRYLGETSICYVLTKELSWQAEKEARRLRRVQANRESARQTIRRKQVLCEELARKAGELQTEKETLSQVGPVVRINMF
jgi:hypothetical protein